MRANLRFALAVAMRLPPAPGILYSEIAEQIAQVNGLIPVVAPTVGYHLRVVQSTVSDAQFLKELATKSRDREGTA